MVDVAGAIVDDVVEVFLRKVDRMVFGSTEAPRVRVGDLFEKQGNPRTIWRVDALIERPGHPPHVRLVDDARRCDATVATSVLRGSEYRAVLAGET